MNGMNFRELPLWRTKSGVRKLVKSPEGTATGGSDIPLIGGAGGLEGFSLSQKDV